MFDEAGHAEEPLALAAVAGLAGHNTKLVLAGDPRQLGPVILSPLARYGGLDVSLMERLIARAPYAPPEPEVRVAAGLDGVICCRAFPLQQSKDN
jgi:superfamily I DNA and/or RNA helicase